MEKVMSDTERPRFKGGKNIAMKVPPHLFELTVAFYRKTLGLPPLQVTSDICGFQFGAAQLWIDRVSTVSQAELWLQVETPDTQVAGQYLKESSIVRCDQIEPLPDGYAGFWVSSPANVVHLVSAAEGAVKPFAPATIDEVVGSLPYTGPKKSLKDIEEGIRQVMRDRS
jgi:hypothetical protein